MAISPRSRSLRPAHWYWLAALVLLLATHGQAADKWLHSASDYRAIYTVKTQPNYPRAGYYVEVPDFALGDGNTAIWAFAANGKALDVWTVGPSRDNCTLVLVGAGTTKLEGEIEVYFGGPRRSPQARAAFEPGLRLTFRTSEAGAELKTWKESEAIYKKSTVLGTVPVGAINHAANLIDDTDAVIMEYDGAMIAAAAEDRFYLLASDDAGYLFINGKMVIERNGRHYAGDVRGNDGLPVSLKPGVNTLHCLVVDSGGGQTATLVRWLETRKFHPETSDAYVVSGFTTLAKVEARNGKVCPVWKATHHSYMQLPGYTLTDVELQTHSGDDVEWRLANGARGEGKSFRTVVVGLDNMPARTRADRVEAVGVITFATIPPAWSFQHGGQLAHYANLINAQDLDKIDAPTLNAYFELLTQQDRDSRAEPVGRRLLALIDPKARSLNAKQHEFLMTYARAAARQDPAAARAAYRLRLSTDGGDAKDKGKRADIYEYIEFEVFRGGDPAAADKAFTYAADQLGGDRLLSFYRGIRLIQSGEIEAARQHFAELRDETLRETDARALQVQSVESLERMQKFASSGHYVVAEREWRQWAVLSPGAVTDGQYALETAYYFQRLGWYDAGVTLIDGALAYNDLPAFLPDLEFRKAELLRLLERPDEANALYTLIATRYPNHPVAPIAKQRLAGK